MISFSLEGDMRENIVVCVAVIWFICLIALSVPVYGIMHGTSFNMIKLNYFMKGFLFASYFFTAMMVLLWHFCDRVVTAYLPYGVESINECKFMEYVKNGNVHYVEDTSNT